MTTVLEEIKNTVRNVQQDFVYNTRCPTCGTKLLWFGPGTGVACRLLTALCEQCGVYYHVRIEKKWVGTDRCDRCLVCACCCITPEWR